MALNFPASPQLNEEYTAAGVTYIWDGNKWTSKGATSGNPLQPDQDGNVTITGNLVVEGTTITGNSLTVTDISGTSADLSGDLTASNTTLTGNLTAVNGDLSGDLSVAGDINND